VARACRLFGACWLRAVNRARACCPDLFFCFCAEEFLEGWVEKLCKFGSIYPEDAVPGQVNDRAICEVCRKQTPYDGDLLAAPWAWEDR
jgi:hypothetical protein